jgi:hypothetical protein
MGIPFQDRREDTTLQLAHFRKHKRKQVKRTPGKAVINSVNKPIEHNPPGKDASNRIARALGKAADMANSNKARKVMTHKHGYYISEFSLSYSKDCNHLPEASWIALHPCAHIPVCLLHFCCYFVQID